MTLDDFEEQRDDDDDDDDEAGHTSLDESFAQPSSIRDGLLAEESALGSDLAIIQHALRALAPVLRRVW